MQSFYPSSANGNHENSRALTWLASLLPLINKNSANYFIYQVMRFIIEYSVDIPYNSISKR